MFPVFLSPVMVIEESVVIELAAGVGSSQWYSSAAEYMLFGMYMIGRRIVFVGLVVLDGLDVYGVGAAVEEVRFARSSRYLSS